MTSRPDRASRLPVGSSAKRISGRVASARAMAVRCCCPPESSPGRCFSRDSRPRRETTVEIHARSSALGRRSSSSNGSRMLSLTVSVGTRLKAWKTNPIRRLRRADSSSSRRPLISFSPRWTLPEVGRSSPARTCMRVDLPEPEGPITAVSLAGAMSRLTRLRAVTAAPSGSKIFETSRSRAMGICETVVIESLRVAGCQGCWLPGLLQSVWTRLTTIPGQEHEK